MPILKLELADNLISRAHGLMDRKTLNDDQGMLFIFPDKTKKSFWMQNTYIPLDIAFIDDSGKIEQIESMIPMSTRFTSSKNPCRYALEVNEGWFKKHNIGIGFQLFNGKDGIVDIKRTSSFIFSDSAKKQVRLAQLVVKKDDEEEKEEEETPEEEPNELEGNYEDYSHLFDESFTPQAVTEKDPVQNSIMNIMQTIAFAEKNKSQMDIEYWTLGGYVLPKRRLMPVPNYGYPIAFGKNGRRFTGYDSSPTIDGGSWKIKGGTPKNFLIDNIISLNIVQEQGVIPDNKEEVNKPKNLWDRIKNKILKR